GDDERPGSDAQRRFDDVIPRREIGIGLALVDLDRHRDLDIADGADADRTRRKREQPRRRRLVPAVGEIAVGGFVLDVEKLVVGEERKREGLHELAPLYPGTTARPARIVNSIARQGPRAAQRAICIIDKVAKPSIGRRGRPKKRNYYIKLT